MQLETLQRNPETAAMRWLYTLLLYLIAPFVLLQLLWRTRASVEERRRWRERFGIVPRPAHPVAVWVHAVSVGESLAALPLIRTLIERHGHGRVLVTTTTPTGSARIRETLGEQVLHTYAPFDLPDGISRFLERLRPQQVMVMETELWPNLFRALARRGVPLTIANARLSPQSFRGYGRVRGFARATLADCTRIAAQSELDAERFRALGADPARVSVMGNIKFDQAVPEDQLVRGHELRQRLGAARSVWVAASTHEGEEELLLAAHAELLREQPQALLILVPRHPQRFEATARLIERNELPLLRRSEIDLEGLTTPAPALSASVLLGDSMGEMFLYLAASDIAFVGGSLVPIGGHNVLEPAALGLPVLFGPHMHNFLGARSLLMEAQGAIEVSERSLTDTLRVLLLDAARRRQIGAAACAAVAANRGALARLQRLLDLTPT